MESLGSIIKHYRKAKGLTQRELADLINVKHNSISDWENDKNKPHPDIIELLLGVFDIDPNTMFSHYTPSKRVDDAHELASKILSNPKIEKILPIIDSLNEKDMDFLLDFIERLKRE